MEMLRSVGKQNTEALIPELIKTLFFIFFRDVGYI